MLRKVSNNIIDLNFGCHKSRDENPDPRLFFTLIRILHVNCYCAGELLAQEFHAERRLQGQFIDEYGI